MLDACGARARGVGRLKGGELAWRQPRVDPPSINLISSQHDLEGCAFPPLSVISASSAPRISAHDRLKHGPEDAGWRPRPGQWEESLSSRSGPISATQGPRPLAVCEQCILEFASLRVAVLAGSSGSHLPDFSREWRNLHIGRAGSFRAASCLSDLQ